MRERCPSGQREQTVNLPAYAYGGSNPPLPIGHGVVPGEEAGASGSCQTRPVAEVAGIAQLVERQPSKLRVAGSSPVSRSRVAFGGKCPRSSGVEHFLGKEEATGSIPVVGFDM